MAYAVIHFFAGGTKEQYRASLAAVHPNSDTLPSDQVAHIAGPTPGGWTVVAVHKSKAGWEKFRDDTLMPQMKRGIPGGFTAPPQETAFEVENFKVV